MSEIVLTVLVILAVIVSCAWFARVCSDVKRPVVRDDDGVWRAARRIEHER